MLLNIIVAAAALLVAIGAPMMLKSHPKVNEIIVDSAEVVIEKSLNLPDNSIDINENDK